MRQRSRRWLWPLLLGGGLGAHLGGGCAAGSDALETSGGVGGSGSVSTSQASGQGGATPSSSSMASSSGVGGGSSNGCSKQGDTRPCYGGDPSVAGIGACVMGSQTCEGSGEFLQWGACTGWTGPSPEVCDGFDNDCDGKVDESCCNASPEICDGLDNDCDGIVDNGANCGPGSCGGGPAPCAVIPIPPKQALGSTCKQPFPPAAGLPCPVPNQGTQYYVSAKTGSDAKDGKTPATAWASLCYAVSAAPSGSTLQVAEGDYASAEVYVGKELTVKGGYDATFSSWDPDLHLSSFYGKLTLDHNAAVWGGFRLLGNPIKADKWSYTQHRIGAGTLLRNYIEIVAVSGVDPNVLNLYGIDASACPGGVSVLRCNDIYVRSSAPQAFVVNAIRYGSLAPQGKAVTDSNRVCQDGGGGATAAIAGYGTCGPTPASVLIRNNVIEKSGFSGGEGVEFYGCGMANLDLTLTNNTILTSGAGISGYEGPPSLLKWKLTNNIVFSMQGGSKAIDVGSGAVQISSGEGNLTFGFQSNGILPAPLVSAGNDTSGMATPTSVFVAPAAGDFHLKPGGQGAGTGINVYGVSAYGAVTSDIVQAPRPMGGAWGRGAYGP